MNNRFWDKDPYNNSKIVSFYDQFECVNVFLDILNSNKNNSNIKMNNVFKIYNMGFELIKGIGKLLKYDILENNIYKNIDIESEINDFCSKNLSLFYHKDILISDFQIVDIYNKNKPTKYYDDFISVYGNHYVYFDKRITDQLKFGANIKLSNVLASKNIFLQSNINEYVYEPFSVYFNIFSKDTAFIINKYDIKNHKNYTTEVLKTAIVNIVDALKVFEYALIYMCYKNIYSKEELILNKLDEEFIEFIKTNFDRIKKYFKEDPSLNFSVVSAAAFNISDINDTELFNNNIDSIVNFIKEMNNGIFEEIDDNSIISHDNNTTCNEMTFSNIDDIIEMVVNQIEGCVCKYGNTKTQLFVPENIKNYIRTVISYQYEPEKYYTIGVATVNFYNKDNNDSVVFPIIVLKDADGEIIGPDKINNEMISNTFSLIEEWLIQELLSFGIPLEIIMGGVDTSTTTYSIENSINSIDQNNIEDKDKIDLSRPSSVILIDRKNTDELLSGLLGIPSQNDIEDLFSFNKKTDYSTDQSSLEKNNSIEFSNSLNYSIRIEEELSKYIESLKVNYILNRYDFKTFYNVFKSYSDMSIYDYFRDENNYLDFIYSEIYQGDSLIVNINYKDILLDSLLFWCNNNEFYYGRIYDKINDSSEFIKNSFRNTTKYNRSYSGLNLNIFSRIGTINVDLNGLCKYVFDNKFNSIIFTNFANNKNDRSKNNKIFEIIKYIWSTMANIFMKEYIKDISYIGPNQYKEFGYLSIINEHSISKEIDELENIVKENKIHKEDIDTIIKIIEAKIKDDKSIKDIDYNDIKDIIELFPIFIKFPDNTKMYFRENNMYRLKPRMKSLYDSFDSHSNHSGEFNIQLFNYSKNPKPTFIDNTKLLLIQNIDNNFSNFDNDILKVFKYLKYLYK